ncbi:VWA domain-containing protein [Streptomyces sp. XM4193]|uniref:VWA domain-containing protein n=1 Tax=Streptomyces sp. XM4193 TaxID=2929782 RepID=UPI001FFAEA5B|nr:VWA domain-containing protein [Streptomyces sp. XM4193]MCK1794913.1 VWA domain-containing protein [Streptomyces sp. XM4193]
MGIRSLLRNLFGRSAEPKREPEPSPAEQHAVPQTAKDQNDTDPTTDRPAGTGATAAADSPAPEATDTADTADTANASDASDASDEKAPAASTEPADRTDSPATSPSSAENRDDEDDEDDNRVPSPRFAADDARSENGGSEGVSSSGRTTSADFLDSVAGAGHEESPDLGTVEPTRPAAASAATDTPAADTTADSDSDSDSDANDDTNDVDKPETADTKAPAADASSADAQPEAAQPEAAQAAKPETVEPETGTQEAQETAEPQEAPEPREAAEPRTATVPHQASEPTEATTRATTETSENATAAVSLEKVTATAPGLISLYKAAAVSLEKRGIAGQRAAVYLVLDRSGSMRRYYKDGTVQHLAEQVLGLSAHLDDDGTVPVVFFSTEIDGSDEIDLTNYSGRVEELHASYGHMGRTNYHRAVEAVIEHYEQSGATDPALVIFQTDGAPTSRAAAEKALCDAASKPLFWQFIGFGDPKSAGLNFLRKLDSGLPVPERRAVDNAGFFHAGLEPRSLSDAELYDALTEEFPQWLEAVREAQIHA